MGTEEIPGVQVAFAPRLLGALDELPVIEARAEAARDGLRVSSALIVAESVVGEAEGLRNQPTLAMVLVEEGFDALRTIASGDLYLRFEVVETR